MDRNGSFQVYSPDDADGGHRRWTDALCRDEPEPERPEGGEYYGLLILRGRSVKSLNQKCGGGRRVIRKKLPN